MATPINPYALFDAKVPIFGPRLMADLGIRDLYAAAVFGSAGQESGGFKHMQEIRPTAGRGGFGWWQWTGSRRVSFERWCLDNRHAITDDEAQVGFLLHELRSTQAGSVRGLKRTTTLHAATETFMLLFERPGKPMLGNREKWAERALHLIQAAHPQAAQPGSPASAPKPAVPLPTPIITPPPVPAQPDSAWEAARKRLVAHYGPVPTKKET